MTTSVRVLVLFSVILAVNKWAPSEARSLGPDDQKQQEQHVFRESAEQEHVAAKDHGPHDKRGHRVSHKRLKHARVNAVKQDMLSKLGYTHAPNVTNVTTPVDEMRRMLRLYKENVAKLEGKVHSLFEDEEYMAKQYHKVTDTGKHKTCGFGFWHSNSLVYVESVMPDVFCPCEM